MGKLSAGIMPDYHQQLPAILERNEGHWVWHETVRPGVYKHVSDSGEECLTVRVIMSPNGRLSSKTLVLLADLVEAYAQGGRRTSRNGFELIGVIPERLEELIGKLEAAGYPVGSTGESLRQIRSCPGFIHCQNALVDSPSLAKRIGDRFFELATSQRLPTSLKMAVSGCPNLCGGGLDTDIGVGGVYLDPPQVDDQAIAGSHCDVGLLCSWCPTGAIRPKPFNGGLSIEINNDRCIRCGSCSSICPSGIKVGTMRGVRIAVGGMAANTSAGPRLARVVAPFVPISDALQYDEVLSIIGRVIDVWRKRAANGERLGDFAEQIGWPAFFRFCDLPFDRRNVDIVGVASVRRNLQIKDDLAQ